MHIDVRGPHAEICPQRCTLRPVGGEKLGESLPAFSGVGLELVAGEQGSHSGRGSGTRYPFDVLEQKLRLQKPRHELQHGVVTSQDSDEVVELPVVSQAAGHMTVVSIDVHGGCRKTYRSRYERLARKIGGGAPAGAVFKNQRETGEILRPDTPGRDPRGWTVSVAGRSHASLPITQVRTI